MSDHSCLPDGRKPRRLRRLRIALIMLIILIFFTGTVYAPALLYLDLPPEIVAGTAPLVITLMIEALRRVNALTRPVSGTPATAFA